MSRKPKKSAKKKLLIIACVVLAVVLVALVAAALLADAFLGNINRIDPNQTYETVDHNEIFEESEPVETDPVSDKIAQVIKDEGTVNILLVGQDRRTNQGTKPQRTDAMILCSINTKKKTITMTSFMRDVWVYIPDHYNQRLNIPYKLGGFPLLNETLDYNFGVSADYNVEIDFSGFMEAIDIVGGVEIELTASEAEYLNRRGNWDLEKNCNWNLKEGKNLLTGSQALAYSRIRQIGGDFGRTNRQRKVLTTLIDKVKTLKTTEVFDLVMKLTPLISTDMTNSQIVGLAMDMLPMLSDMEIVSQRIPTDDQYGYAMKGNASVIVINSKQMEVNRKLLEDTVG